MQKTWRSHLMVAYSLAILAFLYLPLLILAMYSFNESRINAVWTGFTFNWYEALFQNRRVLEALTNSLFIAVISTIASTTLGTIAAIALNRYQYKYKPVINGLLYLPILIPEIVMGLSLLDIFAYPKCCCFSFHRGICRNNNFFDIFPLKALQQFLEF